jgi:hypothetical protein
MEDASPASKAPVSVRYGDSSGTTAIQSVFPANKLLNASGALR